MDLAAERLETDGLGGLASGTVGGERIRRYFATSRASGRRQPVAPGPRPVTTRIASASERGGRRHVVASLRSALRQHWPEYLIEGAGIAIFMVAALLFSTLLFHPGSPAVSALPQPLLRRLLMGVAMGATGACLVYSPWGKQSGAHFNPAFTFTFFRLGKVAGPDALGYAAAHFAGAAAGVALVGRLLGAPVSHPEVRWALTLPGHFGVPAAFVAEVAISFGLMSVALLASNAARWHRFTGLLCGLLVASYITVEAPISGMSMNPARSFGSAAGAGRFESLWIYFLAPPFGMLLAAESYVRLRGAARLRCAKLHHQNDRRCIFRCGWTASS